MPNPGIWDCCTCMSSLVRFLIRAKASPEKHFISHSLNICACLFVSILVQLGKLRPPGSHFTSCRRRWPLSFWASSCLEVSISSSARGEALVSPQVSIVQLVDPTVLAWCYRTSDPTHYWEHPSTSKKWGAFPVWQRLHALGLFMFANQTDPDSQNGPRNTAP